MAGFEWQTEAEGEAHWSPEARTPSAGRAIGPWVWLPVLAILAIVAAVLVRRELRQQVLAVEAEKKAEIRAAHLLAEDAAARGDHELFRGLLSGRDSLWVDAQMQRLEENLLFAQASRPLGFELVSSSTEASISLDPSQREALVTEEHRFRIVEPAGGTETVTMLQTFVYRRGEDRWYLSPPQEEFWGDWQAVGDGRLRSVFPEREAALVRRLHGALRASLEEFCGSPSPAVNCSELEPIRLRFSPRPESVLHLEEAAWTVDARSEIVLPAPTLLGSPAEDAGFRALSQAYARRVTATLMADLVDYRCCRRATAYSAALLRMQHQLGLSAWPLDAGARLRLLSDFATLHELEPAWNAPELGPRRASDQLLIYALIDYYVEERHVQAADLVAGIADGAAIDAWFSGGAGKGEKVWRNYVFRTVSTAQEQMGQAVDSPSQDLLLTCYSEGQSHLYRYGGATGEVTKGIQGVGEAAAFYLLIPLPGDEHVVLAQSRSTPSAAPRLWQGRDGVTLLKHPDRGHFFIPARPTFRRRALDPDGRFLPTWIFDYGTSRVSAVLLDLASCQENCSEWLELADDATFPTWAPGGDDLLWTQNRRVMRGHPDAAKSVARGNTPFWLDDETYGYLSEGTVFLAQPTDDRQKVLLTTEHLLAAIPEGGPGYGGSLNGIEAAPDGSGSLIFSVNGGNSGDNYLILLNGPDTHRWQRGDRARKDLTVLLQTGADIYPPPYSGFSPDGRWFAARTRGNRGQEPQLLIYDLQAPDQGPRLRLPATRFFESYDWSADGRWLARPMSNYVLLAAPESGTFRYVFAPHSFNDWSECSSVAWIHPQ